MVLKPKNNKVAFSMGVPLSRIKTKLLKRKSKYDQKKTTSKTLKLAQGSITINDNRLQRSSSNKKFFEKYEIGKLIAEGGNGSVFTGNI